MTSTVRRQESSAPTIVTPPADPASASPVAPSEAVVAAGGVRPVDSASPPWGLTTKSIVTISVLFLTGLVLWRFQSLIRPIVIAAVLAYLVNPIVVWMMRQWRMSRGMAVVTLYLSLLVLFLVGIGVLGIVAYDQIMGLARLLPDSMTEFVNLLQTQLDAMLARLSTLVGYDLRSLAQVVDLRSLAEQAVGILQTTLRRGGSLAASLAQTTLNTVSTAILIFFVSLYIAKDGPQFARAFSDAAHQSGYRRDAERLMRAASRIWNAYLRGQVILGLVIGVVVSMGLAALGVNNSLGLGILSGLLEFLPIIGPLIGTVAAVLVALFQPDNYLGINPLYHALSVLIFMILVQQVENNLLVPRIVGDALDLHPLLVMVGVLMGASLAGILGAILAAPVIATVKLIGGYAWRKLLDLPPFPEPEPPPKPRRGQTGLAGQWRLWRMRLNPIKRHNEKTQ